MSVHGFLCKPQGSSAGHLSLEKILEESTWKESSFCNMGFSSFSFLIAAPDSCLLLSGPVQASLRETNSRKLVNGLCSELKESVTEEDIRTSREPQKLFEKLAADLKAMWSIGNSRMVAKNILVCLKYHEVTLESSLCLFDAVKRHLESPVQEYYEIGAVLTAAITGAPVDEELKECSYFGDVFSELSSSRKCGEENVASECAYTDPIEEIFRGKIEVKNHVPPPSRRYRYLQQALDILDDSRDFEVRCEAFQQLPSLIKKTSVWMLNIVFQRCFDTLVLNDDNETAALDGLKALYFKHSATFYMAVDFMNSNKSTLRTRLLVVEFTSQLVDLVDSKTTESLLIYFLCTANEALLKHNFIIHNARCLLQKALAKVGMESRLFAMVRSQASAT